jgi:spoIIIJ-associated protein
MTKSHEFNAATVDEAVAKASTRLGIPEQELSYEVIDKGGPGFLGIGARDARISVSSSRLADSSTESSETPIVEESPEQEHKLEAKPTAVADGLVSDIDQSAATVAVAPEDLLSEIEDFTMKAVKGMGFDARVEVYDAGECIAVDVSPGDTGLFIGQKGETIDAFQHLLNIAVYNNRDFVKRIIIDSEGYRQRRIEAVQGMAHRMARRATREGRTVELPPMSSSERRIVHTYLKENPKVSTDSEGSGENRRVIISPVP